MKSGLLGALPKMRNEAVADADRIVRVAGELGREGSLLEHGPHGDEEDETRRRRQDPTTSRAGAARPR